MYYWINNLYEQGDSHLTPIFFKDGHLCLKRRTIFVPNFLYPSVSLWISLLHFISPFLCLYMLYVMCACVCSLCAFICFMYIVLCACMCFLLACALVKVGGMQFIPYFITPHLVVKDELFFSAYLKLHFWLVWLVSLPSNICLHAVRVTCTTVTHDFCMDSRNLRNSIPLLIIASALTDWAISAVPISLCKCLIFSNRKLDCLYN